MAAGERLRALEAALDGPTTLGELTHRLRHSGFSLVVVLVSLPFLQPIPLGGLSTIVGPFIAWMGWRLFTGARELHVPRRFASSRLDERAVRILLGVSRRVFGLVERISTPRWRGLAAAESAAGAGIALSGALLSLPFPIPLSNMICAGPATLLALGLLEEDGLLSALGWLGLGLSVCFHAGLAMLGGAGLRALFS